MRDGTRSAPNSFITTVLGTAFENLLKAESLDTDMVVHEFVRRPEWFRSLAEERKKRPVSVAELRSVERNTWRGQGHFTIAGLKHRTILFSTLINAESQYPQALGLDAELMQALNSKREHRNTVHLVMNDMGRFNDRVVAYLRCMRDVFNIKIFPALSKPAHALGASAWARKFDLREI